MPILKVLINEEGEVVGTAQPDVGGSGAAAPQSVTLVAGQGQRVIEINVDDTVVSLEPAALHAAVIREYKELIKTKPSDATEPKTGE